MVSCGFESYIFRQIPKLTERMVNGNLETDSKSKYQSAGGYSMPTGRCALW